MNEIAGWPSPAASKVPSPSLSCPPCCPPCCPRAPTAEDQLQRLPQGVEQPPAAAEAQEAGEGELNFLLLRQKAAEYMRQHAEEFKPFVLEVRGAPGPPCPANDAH